MKSNPWNIVIKMVGGFLLLQPMAAVLLLVLVISTPASFGQILVVVGFTPVALLGGHVGFGTLASRPWARSRLAFWAPLHVLFIPALYWVMSKPAVEGGVVAVVVGLLLYGLHSVMESEYDETAKAHVDRQRQSEEHE